jgi:hypothetical protein
MTLAVTTNIILSAIAFAAIVGLITWSIMTSRTAQPTTSIKVKGARERSTDRRAGVVVVQSHV